MFATRIQGTLVVHHTCIALFFFLVAYFPPTSFKRHNARFQRRKPASTDVVVCKIMTAVPSESRTQILRPRIYNMGFHFLLQIRSLFSWCGRTTGFRCAGRRAAIHLTFSNQFVRPPSRVTCKPLLARSHFFRLVFLGLSSFNIFLYPFFRDCSTSGSLFCCGNCSGCQRSRCSGNCTKCGLDYLRSCFVLIRRP